MLPFLNLCAVCIPCSPEQVRGVSRPQCGSAPHWRRRGTARGRRPGDRAALIHAPVFRACQSPRAPARPKWQGCTSRISSCARRAVKLIDSFNSAISPAPCEQRSCPVSAPLCQALWQNAVPPPIPRPNFNLLKKYIQRAFNLRRCDSPRSWRGSF